ncbi:hypothetical protein SESBI_43871 [Sesbania bispinosa]|nr:hypothetical protein SESBI_43871 [Sesbania bispinosa]
MAEVMDDFKKWKLEIVTLKNKAEDHRMERSKLQSMVLSLQVRAEREGKSMVRLLGEVDHMEKALPKLWFYGAVLNFKAPVQQKHPTLDGDHIQSRWGRKFSFAIFLCISLFHHRSLLHFPLSLSVSIDLRPYTKPSGEKLKLRHFSSAFLFHPPPSVAAFPLSVSIVLCFVDLPYPDEDIRGLEFDTEEDAYDFYREYAKFIGFSVRKGDVYRNCNDYRSRKWRVGIFEPTHNHELTPASMIHLLPPYRGLSVADKAQVDGLHHYGVRTCHIMGQKGGYSDLGFCKKDLYNHIDKENRAKIEDGDAFAALCYLQSKHNELTSDFKSKYTQPVMTTALERYEVQASNVYTRNKFFDVRKQIEKVAAMNVIERTDVGNVITMKMNKFGTPDSSYTVTLDKSDEGDTSKKDLLRSGAVGAACKRFNKAARTNPHNFVKNIESIHKLAEQMERQEGIDLNVANISRVVRDPTVVKTKGAPRKNKKMTKKRKCSYCKHPGHTVRTCTKYATRDQLDIVIEEESSVETDEDSRDESRSRDVLISNHLNDVTVSAGQNCASDKGQSKKRRRNSEGLKMTQESVNERRSSDVNKGQQNDTGVAFSRMNTPSLFGNHVYYSNMNGPSISRPVHIRPSMIHGFGQGFVGNRVEDMLQYPQIYMPQSMYTLPVVHNFDQYGNSFQFPNAMNNVERNNGAGSKGFGKK